MYVSIKKMAEWTPNDYSNIATVGAAALCSLMMVFFKSRCSKITLCCGLWASPPKTAMWRPMPPVSGRTTFNLRRKYLRYCKHMEASDAAHITENIQEQQDLIDDHLVHRDEQEPPPDEPPLSNEIEKGPPAGKARRRARAPPRSSKRGGDAGGYSNRLAVGGDQRRPDTEQGQCRGASQGRHGSYGRREWRRGWGAVHFYAARWRCGGGGWGRRWLQWATASQRQASHADVGGVPERRRRRRQWKR